MQNKDTEKKPGITIVMKAKDSEKKPGITIVYQDCYLCGERKKTAPKKLQEILHIGYSVELIRFSNPAADSIISKAVEHGVGAMPIYTDGEYYTAKLNDMLEHLRRVTGTSEAEKPKKARKVAKKKELEDGTIPEV